MYPAYLQRRMHSGCSLMLASYMCDRVWETSALRVTSGALSTSSRSVSKDVLLHKINVSLLNQCRKMKMAVSLNQCLNQGGPTFLLMTLGLNEKNHNSFGFIFT